jgi:GTP diphosphokinase / guanosine-3',5'-bis(diphosphate) 3'-diphosphatase
MHYFGSSNTDPFNLVIRAAYFAGEKHRLQRRSDVEQTPYINHPLELAHILTEEGGINCLDTICASLLHDTLEDTVTSSDELKKHFGEIITSIVMEVSNDMTLTSQQRRVYELEKVASLSQKAKLVKIVDKLANIRDVSTMPPMGWTREKKQNYFDFALEIVNKIGSASPRLHEIFLRDYHFLKID